MRAVPSLIKRARETSALVAPLPKSPAAKDDALEVFHTLTRSRPEGWEGYDRRIDARMLSELAWPPERNPLAFVCGPTPLVEAAGTALVGLGHDPARVKTERFGATGG